jgi:hypothetical protein
MKKPRRKRKTETETVAEILDRWLTPLRSYGPPEPEPGAAKAKPIDKDNQKETKS